MLIKNMGQSINPVIQINQAIHLISVLDYKFWVLIKFLYSLGDKPVYFLKKRVK